MSARQRTPYRPGSRLRPACAGALVAVALLAASGTHAQQASELRGIISGPDGKPVAGAHVAVAGTSIFTVTDVHGAYQLLGIPPGPRRVGVEYLGYGPVHLELDFVAGVLLRRDVRLDVVALPGTPLEARAGSMLTPQLRGFYDRLDRGLGTYFTPADIERMQARQFTDVLRRVPGLQLHSVPGPYGTSYMVQLGRTTGAAGGRGCPVLFYLNGVPFQVAADIGIDNFVRPDEIAGIEVYSGSNLPSQFSGGQHNARCGVIVVWTHAGRQRGR
jgi:hypothetical protein